MPYTPLWRNKAYGFGVFLVTDTIRMISYEELVYVKRKCIKNGHHEVSTGYKIVGEKR
jgi:hypothetical protein